MSALHFLIRWLLVPVLCLLGGIYALWAAGALYFDLPAPGWVRTAAALGWLVALVAGLILVRPAPLKLALVGVAFVGLFLWWISQQPSQNRDWKPEVAMLPYAEVNGDVIVLHNVRNFEYRTKDDFTASYDTRTLNLGELRGIDIFQNYWGSPNMAHPITSFDFGPQGHVAFSIETRPEQGEKYSPIGGLYRQFELITIAADERDVVRVRANYRVGEDVYLYRLNLSPAAARERFMDYVTTINRLKEQPQWYNAITHNCTTGIRAQHSPGERIKWDWRILVNGHADEMLYELGAINGTLPFPELKQQAHINPRAQAANDAADFSQRIRTHLAPWPVVPGR